MQRTAEFILLIAAYLAVNEVEAIKPTRSSLHPVPAEYRFPMEGEPVLYDADQLPRPSRIHFPDARDVEVMAVLVDSSRNGYGMLLGTTNPLTYVPNQGFIWGYRQWSIENPNASGYMGAAFSLDGEAWDVYSNLNIAYPGETYGRYPSAVGGSEYPYIVWNEYTQSGDGGGQYGGRPLYTWDVWGYGIGDFQSPPIDINNGCNPVPCDPEDNWVGCPVVSQDATGTPILNITYSGWSGTSSNPDAPVRYLYHSNFHQFGYFMFDDAVELYDDSEFEWDTATGSYTSPAIIDINGDGIGYSAVISYFQGVITAGQTPLDSAHTFMIRKTTDYGATWSTEGLNGSKYFYIPSEWLNSYFVDNGLHPEWYVGSEGDSSRITEAYIPYDFDLKVDPDGGLHLFAPVIPSDGEFIYWIEGCSFYHLYNADPSNATAWTASPIAPLDATYMYKVYDGDQVLSTSNYFRIFPSAALSVDDPNIMYVTWEAYSDTSEARINFDVFLSRSTDGGNTWEDPVNITNTVALGVDEIHPHLSPTATDEECYVVYMAPDYGTQTVPELKGPEDFKQRLFFAKVNFGGVAVDGPEIVPEVFELTQNFPNPFNPETVIQYTLSMATDVQLVVYDLLGREVGRLVDGRQEAGNYQVHWDGSTNGNGVYLYRLTTGDQTLTRKMVLLK